MLSILSLQCICSLLLYSSLVLSEALPEPDPQSEQVTNETTPTGPDFIPGGQVVSSKAWCFSSTAADRVGNTTADVPLGQFYPYDFCAMAISTLSGNNISEQYSTALAQTKSGANLTLANFYTGGNWTAGNISAQAATTYWNDVAWCTVYLIFGEVSGNQYDVYDPNEHTTINNNCTASGSTTMHALGGRTGGLWNVEIPILPNNNLPGYTPGNPPQPQTDDEGNLLVNWALRNASEAGYVVEVLATAATPNTWSPWFDF
ncbi:hypothetical protein MMC09_006232 [Bachmanniomyces sp. S44760]|nr:hypothetical protein [Bachmanniomyces sp. S44760]